MTGLVVIGLTAAPLMAKKKAEAPVEEAEALLTRSVVSGLKFREIGPAIASGRVSDIAVDPRATSVWYVAVASGNLWKTVNAGTTWQPIFDGEASYSIGCVTIDPSDSNVIWVGTGENNSQRSVPYGDGVYKSVDGGKSWNNVGLTESEHIGRIVVHPEDSSVVWVAAQGPLWRAGGDRGLYKTVDGGETWKQVLEISENTGVNEVWIDPSDPDVLYASSYQRRRRTWTLIDGGPESAIYKSVDGGETWNELTNGLPSEDMGKIGLAVSPVDSNVIYAIIESIDDADGFYRSTDGGASWEKRSDYVSGSPQYYNEIVPDPHDVDRVYSMDTWMHVTEDGGASFEQVPETSKHVDNHALWIDPDDVDHLVAGCDGGVYETFDRGTTWVFSANLPITQFYKMTVDNDQPFYNVYGGTQDNSTLGGPSRTTSTHGINNRDWFVVVGGDGFQPRVDPKNPDIVYAEWQNGGLVRYDRKNGETVDIQPQPELGEAASRWNWDSPLIISPHSATRLYYGSQRLYRSDDRGDSWSPSGPDLTRQIDRNALEIMGKVWSVDTVAKNRSTSYFGNIVSLAESQSIEGLLYAGTDDGLIQVSEDGGANWRREQTFPGVPDMSSVADLVTSLHDGDTLFAAFDAHKDGDFKPYLLKSTDRGRSWASIAGNLPDRGTVYTFAEDHEKPELLFVGTEFGVFFTVDGGQAWIELTGGVPNIPFRDLAIQKRENDLVGATFGRSFFVFDDYTPLRHVNEELLAQEAELFPVREAKWYIPRRPFGFGEKGSQGDAFYSGPNPPFGAVFTYYLKDSLQTLKQVRQEEEKEIAENDGDTPYPGWDALREEELEEKPEILLTVINDAGEVVRRVTGPASAGFHRVAWDLRYPSSAPEGAGGGFFGNGDSGYLAAPGTYTVSLAKRSGGIVTDLGKSQTFDVVPLRQRGLIGADPAQVAVFMQELAAVQRRTGGTHSVIEETEERLEAIKIALTRSTAAGTQLEDRARALLRQMQDLHLTFDGNELRETHGDPGPATIQGRLGTVGIGNRFSTYGPTAMHRRQFEIAKEEFEELAAAVSNIVSTELPALEADLDAAGVPWSQGRGVPN
jgi:photosystem II stability/assembly factor-like uncharacterized protein